jgi:RNA polymerase sigma-70 factor, ECF subfamily
MNSSDKNKFVALVKEHQNIIHKICHVYCYTKEDKQDLSQEIILQLYKSYDSFEGKSSFGTWVYRVALNTAITKTKRPNLFVDTEQDELLVLSDSEAFTERDEEIIVLYKAIGKLNKIEKAIILLWLEEKSYQEIADITGLTVKNVSVKLVRAKNRLSQIIKTLW